MNKFDVRAPRVRFAYWTFVVAALLLVIDGFLLLSVQLRGGEERTLVALANVLGGVVLAAAIGQFRGRLLEVAPKITLLAQILIALNLLALALGAPVLTHVAVILLLSAAVITLRRAIPRHQTQAVANEEL
ncbi:hypothetical protein [Corynebacterium gerontici]|uniref:Uncharacterized protein n=1 Tax=Corynebacterium gerontici TaxID=2079234 RepID=A0A3G6J3E6_9CORY|nr:hypothetical protein [Corynebacterium gerontici]AZA12223.1 hypothetical protein CGERO_09680 [Corynebacterium gerontici]